ncbi:MAG: hypothetical protein R2778_12300 [Saprospiraceae bacterium]
MSPLNPHLASLRFFSVVIVTSLCMLAVFYSVFPSPRETDLMREISQMESKYKQMSEQVDVMSKVLQNIQDRDANAPHGIWYGSH